MQQPWHIKSIYERICGAGGEGVQPWQAVDNTTKIPGPFRLLHLHRSLLLRAEPDHPVRFHSAVTLKINDLLLVRPDMCPVGAVSGTCRSFRLLLALGRSSLLLFSL